MGLRFVGSLFTAALTAATLGAGPCAAQASGFEIGARTGYAVALGKAADTGSDLDDLVTGMIPLWLDIGARIKGHFFVGGYVQLGVGLLDDALDDLCEVSDEVTCSVTDVRTGVQAHYHFQPGQTVDPWLGVGLGLEWLMFSAEGPGGMISQTLFGFEFLNLQAGLDLSPTRHLYLGPFIGFSLGQFVNAAAECNRACGRFDIEIDGEIEDKALHEWLQLGVRVAYAP